MEKPQIEFVYATFIRTTPEKRWEALTSGDFSRRYWFGFRFEAELKVGETVRIHPPKGMEQHGDQPGEVLVCEPNRKLVYTCPPRPKVRSGSKRFAAGRAGMTMARRPIRMEQFNESNGFLQTS